MYTFVAFVTLPFMPEPYNRQSTVSDIRITAFDSW
jgi:hypothetical protein